MRYRSERRRWVVELGVRSNRVDPDPTQPPPAPDEEVVRQLRMDADAARAESARVKRELDDIKRQLPTEEQRARWAELEAQHQKAEEDRLKKEGDFTAWRQQTVEKHEKEIAAERSLRENAAAQAASIERDLNTTLVAQQFASAIELFGPTGKTVMPPDVAQAYFARNVEVEVVPAPNGGPANRRVVVRDNNGAIILDTKTGHPQSFAKAMAELIDSHPQKLYLLRGSGKVGSNSTGGAHGGGDIDLNRLKSTDFKDPKVRDAVRQQQNTSGGLQIGPGFDRLRKQQQRG